MGSGKEEEEGKAVEPCRIGLASGEGGEEMKKKCPTAFDKFKNVG